MSCYTYSTYPPFFPHYPQHVVDNFWRNLHMRKQTGKVSKARGAPPVRRFYRMLWAYPAAHAIALEESECLRNQLTSPRTRRKRPPGATPRSSGVLLRSKYPILAIRPLITLGVRAKVWASMARWAVTNSTPFSGLGDRLYRSFLRKWKRRRITKAVLAAKSATAGHDTRSKPQTTR
jgi:hypothetical protein